MKLSSHQKDLIRIANEMGYSPTPAQAEELSRASCDAYQAWAVPPNPCDEKKARACDAAAIKEVMSAGDGGGPMLRARRFRYFIKLVSITADADLEQVAKMLGFKDGVSPLEGR
jgi:hypothetical protein